MGYRFISECPYCGSEGLNIYLEMDGKHVSYLCTNGCRFIVALEETDIAD